MILGKRLPPSLLRPSQRKGGLILIEESSFSHNRIRVRYHGVSSRDLEQMEPERLDDELKRVERDLKLWRQMVKGKPSWFRSSVEKQRNCLAGEKRRIERELAKRATALIRDHSEEKP